MALYPSNAEYFYLVKCIILTLFVFLSVVFSSAIPEMYRPYSFADLFLIISSSVLIALHNKKMLLLVVFGVVSFLFSSLFGGIRGFNVSEITAVSLIAKWAGVLAVYFLIIKNIRPSHHIMVAATVLQAIVFISILFDLKPFPGSYYEGSTGIFQASADGGYFVLCMLGLFMHLSKVSNSKIVYFNIFLASITLILVDSRFGFILGLVTLAGGLFLKNKRILLLILVVLLFLFFLLDITIFPPKIFNFIYQSVAISDLFNNDLSLMIRFYNFEEAFRISDYWTVIFGNGGKFFKLTANNFFDGNFSLDNTYIYIYLSFGLIGIFVFYMFFLSNFGLRIGGRGALTFVALTFPLMQDVFSNSFNLLTLAIIMAFDRVLYKYFSELNFH